MTAPDWSAAEAAALREVAAWPAHEPGGVILGFDARGQVFAAASGVETLGGAAFGASTVSRWASVTKHVFANAVVESGLLPLSMPLAEVLPEMHPVPGAVTVRQALSMQGGLPDTRELLTLSGFSADEVTGPAALLRWSAAVPRLNAVAGTEVAYSNAGYRLVEAALERRGLRFADFVADVSRRLGLGMKAPEFWTDPVEGLVPGHVPDGAGWRIGGQGMHLSAAGSLAGSALDLAGWLSDLMTRDSFAVQAAAVPLASGRGTDYGLGLRRTELGGRVLIGHGGSQSGYKTGFLLAPELGAGVVLISNRDDTEAEGMTRRVLSAALGITDTMAPAKAWAKPGLYVGEGNLWAEVREASIVVRDAEEALFVAGDWAVSRPGRPETKLRVEGDAIVGEIGYLSCRLLPAEPAEPALDGLWESGGNTFAIRDGAVHWGRGPNRTVAPLQPLGQGRWLFKAAGRRICLREIAADRVELSLARARVVEYARLAADPV